MAEVTWQVLQGDARKRLAEIPDNSIHCAVTSPPYWGLRDYGTAVWEGGEADCTHEVPLGKTAAKWKQITNVGSHRMQYDEQCKCGAVKVEDLQIGLEKSPEEYIVEMVKVFREVKRALRDDGILWVNIGDSYANTEPRKAFGDQGSRGKGADSKLGEIIQRDWSAWKLKPKELAGMPWRLAFALQTDGWYIRSDIIWSKPNPMPESVTDRPTKAHEYVFMLTKSPEYFYDADAIREKAIGEDAANFDSDADGFYRNKRSVWEIPSQPYAEAHFATFPENLVNPCVKASTSEEGCCPVCGAQWERFDGGDDSGDTPRVAGDALKTTTAWWTRTCEHREDPIPCTVLDPFSGSGTTGVAALKLRRSYIGVELSEEYAEMSRTRLKSTMPLFSGETNDESREEASLFL